MHPFWSEILRKLLSWHAAQFFDDALGRVLSWPVAAVVVAFVFRSPLRELIERIEQLSFKTPAAEGQLSSPKFARAQEAQVAVPEATIGQRSAPLDVGEDELGPAKAQTFPESVQQRRHEIESIGSDRPIVALQVEAFEKELTELGYALDSPELVPLLLRQLAVFQIVARNETAYRLIFGSQVRALRSLKIRAKSSDELFAYYASAYRKAPKFYADYAFVQWLDYLIRNNLILLFEGKYHLTNAGAALLDFIDDLKLARKRH